MKTDSILVDLGLPKDEDDIVRAALLMLPCAVQPRGVRTGIGNEQVARHIVAKIIDEMLSPWRLAGEAGRVFCLSRAGWWGQLGDNTEPALMAAQVWYHDRQWHWSAMDIRRPGVDRGTCGSLAAAMTQAMYAAGEP